MNDSHVSHDLTGQVFVVTGANSGIGFEACKRFARDGATIALVCRDAEKGATALQSILDSYPHARLKLFVADLSSLAQVKTLAAELLQSYSSINVLCNNAGGANASRKLTQEGFELTLVANHLSGFVLTKLLMPALLAAGEKAGARIVFTSSLGHKNSALNFDDLGLKQGYGTFKAYGRSKLMNLLTARKLHQIYGDKNIKVSSFHPGAVRTAIWKKGGILAKLIGLLMYPFMWSVEKGADTLVWLACSQEKDADDPRGEYFFDRKRASIAVFATEDASDRLWEASEALVKQWLQ